LHAAGGRLASQGEAQLESGEIAMASLAEVLWTARTNGAVIAIEPAQAPTTAAAAYQVQAALIRLAGLTRVGWKLGATTAATQELLKVEEPLVGPLFAPHVHPDGAEVALVADHRPGLESEFLVGLGADLAPRQDPYEAGEVAAAVDFVAPAFEIIGCRFEGGLAGQGLLAIADGGGNAAIVRGEPVRDWRRFDLSRHPVRLRMNGAETASGSSSDLVFGDPIGAVAWLANHPVVARSGLKRGEIVMTGTCTGLTFIKRGDTAIADYGDLGQVRATFV
jgi:2-keto-4-pentenoate hydratase